MCEILDNDDCHCVPVAVALVMLQFHSHRPMLRDDIENTEKVK